MTEEIWKPVVGFEDSYEVSNLGRVRSLDRIVTDTRRRDIFYRGRVLKTVRTHKGYTQVKFRCGDKWVAREVHVLVLAAFKGPRPLGMEGRHLDGKRHNNVLSNLEYGTRKQNSADRVVHGTDLRGESHPHAVLTDDLVRAIRNASGTPVAAWADTLGVSEGAIRHVRAWRTWRHV